MRGRIQIFNRYISLTVWDALSPEQQIELTNAIEKDNKQLAEEYRKNVAIKVNRFTISYVRVYNGVYT